ncbi:MAG TPA: L,D-transpeptidase [Thermoanaerobaculia bacterium]|nr:L,D-transpeptidase [Thermoanaerobaculia bacterium]
MSLSIYRLGFLGAWALFVIAAGLASLAAAGEWENSRDSERLKRLDRIDRMIAEKLGAKLEELREISDEKGGHVEKLRSDVASATLDLDETKEPEQTIIVSTAENRLRVRRGGHTIFEAVCSTGKGTSLEIAGRKMVFDTPTGRFRIQSKEENPVWVPPDWHFVEEARKKNLEVVHLNPGDAIDAATGEPVSAPASGVWSFLKASKSPARVLKVKGTEVVEVSADGSERPLPPGELIRAGKTIVVPPPGSSQRKFDKVLGHFRLNIGNGYALHGTTATRELGRSVSHGCVRLSDPDIEKLFAMAKVGDQVVIY